MMVSLLLLMLCLLVSLVGAWTDITTGKVRNADLLITMGVGFTIYLFDISTYGINWLYLSRWAINFVLSAVLSIVFYLSDIWSPGDAKLFIIIAILFPMDFYAARQDNLFPALSIIVFAYTIGYIFILFDALHKHQEEEKKRQILTFDKSFVVSFLVNTGMIMGVQTIIVTVFPRFFDGNQVLILLCVVGLSYVIQRKWPRVFRASGIGGLLICFLTTMMANQLRTLFILFPVGIIISFSTQVLVNMANTNSYKEIKGEEIKPGMILSFGSVLAMQKCIDPMIPHQTTENRRSRLSIRQAEAVRNWCRITKNSIVIVEMMPFAPFVCLGIIIELVRHLVFYSGR